VIFHSYVSLPEGKGHKWLGLCHTMGFENTWWPWRPSAGPTRFLTTRNPTKNVTFDRSDQRNSKGHFKVSNFLVSEGCLEPSLCDISGPAPWM
jgi:hypothetical protein